MNFSSESEVSYVLPIFLLVYFYEQQWQHLGHIFTQLSSLVCSFALRVDSHFEQTNDND